MERAVGLLLIFFVYLFAFDANQTEFNQSKTLYRWIGDDIRFELYELVKSVQEDETILCRDRFTKLIEDVEALMHQYESTRSDLVAQKLEQAANDLEYAYLKVRNSGCFHPRRFLEDNFLPCKGKSYKTPLRSPVLERLYRMLQIYKNLQKEGGWEPIEIQDELYLRPNKSYDEIPSIRKRLAQEGFYQGEDFNSTLYTPELVEAVKEFQHRHGLKADGIIGPMTVAQMNVSVEDKIKKILLSIERARWFLKEDDFFVFVNIPGFFLEVFENGEPIFYSEVIVGRKKRPTPQMRNLISYAVLNPYWRAPKTIIKEDILPHLQSRDFKTIRAERIVASLDPYGKELVRFEDVDWSYFRWSDVPFYFIQLPGPDNFLGFIKFMFPNRFDVYLHDTNARGLFKYSYRALSSGCVRVRKPIELYHILINRGAKEVTYRDIFDQLWRSRTKRVRIKPNVPVYLLYLTAFMDKDGKSYFYPDIYGIDKKMWELVAIEGK